MYDKLSINLISVKQKHRYVLVISMLSEETLGSVLLAIAIGGIGFAVMLFGAWLVKQALRYLGIRRICF